MPPIARLKELPADQRARVYQIIGSMAYPEAVVAVEQEFGIRAGETALGKFRQWQWRQSRWDALNEMSAHVEEFQRKTHPGASAAEIRDLTIASFMAEAGSSGDLEGFSEMARLSLKGEAGQRQSAALKLERERFEFDASKQCLARLDELKAIKKDSGLSETQKVEQIRLRLFGVAA